MILGGKLKVHPAVSQLQESSEYLMLAFNPLAVIVGGPRIPCNRRTRVNGTPMQTRKPNLSSVSDRLTAKVKCTSTKKLSVIGKTDEISKAQENCQRSLRGVLETAAPQKSVCSGPPAPVKFAMVFKSCGSPSA